MTFFIDVGAGCGEIFTLDDVVPPEQRKATALVCIEPSARNFVHLALASREHAGEWRAVHLLNAALSDRFGWLPFFEKANNRNQVFYRGQNVVPRLEALVSRAVFREISEAQQ